MPLPRLCTRRAAWAALCSICVFLTLRSLRTSLLYPGAQLGTLCPHVMRHVNSAEGIYSQPFVFSHESPAESCHKGTLK